MSERWVIDASLGISWVHPAQATEATAELLQEVKRGVLLVVPVLWFVEIANALLVLERRKKLKPEERRQALTAVSALNIKADFDGIPLTFRKTTELAEKHGLSVYDAAYLELALREQLPLATKDPPLQSAARKCGVRLLLK
jgi:predicted nucleic acid-binding protein